MKHLKFRASRNGSWRYVVFPDGLASMSRALLEELAGGLMADFTTSWQQYTGMHDKDGKEVYEGDIVRRTCLDEHCDLEHIGEVVYSAKWCMYGIDDRRQDRSEIGDYLAPLAWGDPSKNMRMAVEIIDNIVQNPEL